MPEYQDKETGKIEMIKPEKFWDMLANNLDKTEKRLEQIYIKVLQNTKKHLNVSDIVLDYACGTGLICNVIADKVKKIYAIDISSKMLAAAKRKAIEHKIENIDFIQTTIFDERYKKESFDVILAFGILHLLEDDTEIVLRITELLKPGGLFISSTPCLGEKMTLLTKFQFYPVFLLSKFGLIPTMKMYKVPELRDIIGSGNLQIIETEILFNRLSAYFAVAKKPFIEAQGSFLS
jgi:2-polyprenyl-3-methyl-5-hydroxy-6-metoxy-1,4-benzoquinol methylase